MKKLPEQDPNVLRLLKKKRHGLLRIVFSRFGIMFLLILIQFDVALSAIEFFDDYSVVFSVVHGVITLLLLIYLFNCDMDYSAKLTWLVMIDLFPVPVSLLLLYTRSDLGHRVLSRKVAGSIEGSRGKIVQKEEVLTAPEIVESGTDDLCRYLNRSGCYPLFANTDVRFFPLGEDKFRSLLEDLKKAEKFIFLEYFIIDEGLMWGSILKILADKAAEGVDVRVMYDGMCEMSTLSSDYPKRMEKLGIRCKPFSPIRPFFSTYYNYRDHRKIFVIDGKVAYNGGVNLGDEYINHIVRFGHWKDTAVRLEGEAVQGFTLMFLQMWNTTEPEANWDEALIPAEPAEADGWVMPFADDPLDEFKVGENVYMDILNRAKTYVHIMTPYLILDNELETALEFAAQRGVDVRLILPGIPDKKGAYSLAKTHYKSLIRAGVKIFEYTPGFVHAKVFVCDDEKAVVGTINLDYRSLYHHFECATYMFRTSCIPDIEADYQATLAKCRVVTEETIKKERLGIKIRGKLMKFVAPLM